MNIYLDIETIPDQRPGALESFIADARENFRAPSTLTKDQAAKDLGITDEKEIKFTSADSMKAKWAERFAVEKAAEVGEAAWRKTSFDGAQGQVCAIGIAIDDAPVVLNYHDEHECAILQCAFNFLRSNYDPSRNQRPRFIGHNVAEFDLRFLFHRAVILGIEPPLWMPRNPRPWDDTVFDTMTEWAGRNGRVSLDNLCKALGIPGKGSELGDEEIDGSKVWDFVKAGRIEDVATYCAADVERVRKIHKRMTFCEGAP